MSVKIKTPTGWVQVAGNAQGSGVNVIDDLTSTSKSDALSANQGRILNETIHSVTDTFVTLNYADGTKTIEQALASVISAYASTGAAHNFIGLVICASGSYFVSFFADSAGNGMGMLTRYDGVLLGFYAGGGSVVVKS